MQQTEQYKLNLIETSDTFSPNPLNENMEKLEKALGTKTDAAVTAALEQRVISLEDRHVVGGIYIGDSSSNGVYQTVSLGFTPTLVLASAGVGKSPVFVWEGGNWGVSGYEPSLMITEGGFKACSTMNLQLNLKGGKYPFIAIG